MSQALAQSLIALGDDHLILGHRLSEWCGHAPMLEEDLSMPNMALDLLGQARGDVGVRQRMLKHRGLERCLSLHIPIQIGQTVPTTSSSM